MHLKYLFEVVIADGDRRRCLVLADDEVEVARLVRAVGKVLSIVRQPGLVSAVGASRILTWIQDHAMDLAPSVPAMEAPAI